MGFPGSSAGKVSACNAGDSSLTPGSGRSAGEGMGCPLHCSWASLVAQLVNNPPAMRETSVWSMGWKDPLEKGMTTHPSILAWRIPWTIPSMGSQRVGHDWVTFTFTYQHRQELSNLLKVWIESKWAKEGVTLTFFSWTVKSIYSSPLSLWIPRLISEVPTFPSSQVFVLILGFTPLASLVLMPSNSD